MQQTFQEDKIDGTDFKYDKLEDTNLKYKNSIEDAGFKYDNSSFVIPSLKKYSYKVFLLPNLKNIVIFEIILYKNKIWCINKILFSLEPGKLDLRIFRMEFENIFVIFGISFAEFRFL